MTMKTSSSKVAGLDPRRVALALLDAVTIENRLLSEVLTKKTAVLAFDDRARAQRLATECLRVMDRCDRMLGPYLSTLPAPHVMNALRLGVYEMCEAGEASYGVVNSYVSLMQENATFAHFKGLINAVLRKVSGRYRQVGDAARSDDAQMAAQAVDCGFRKSDRCRNGTCAIQRCAA